MTARATPEWVGRKKRKAILAERRADILRQLRNEK